MKDFLYSVFLSVFTIITISGFTLVHADDNTGYSVTEISTENGSVSQAAYFEGKKDQAVIFVPGAIFDKESWYFLAERLQKKNIASLSLDGKTPDIVLASISYLKVRGFKKIALVGGSMGGAAVLNALDREIDSHINKVITLAAAGGQPIKSKNIKKLFIVAKNDSLGLEPEVKELYENSPEPKKLVEIEGSAHAQHLFKTSHKEELTKLIIDFLAN